MEDKMIGNLLDEVKEKDKRIEELETQLEGAKWEYDGMQDAENLWLEEKAELNRNIEGLRLKVSINKKFSDGFEAENKKLREENNDIVLKSENSYFRELSDKRNSENTKLKAENTRLKEIAQQPNETLRLMELEKLLKKENKDD